MAYRKYKRYGKRKSKRKSKSKRVSKLSMFKSSNIRYHKRSWFDEVTYYVAGTSPGGGSLPQMGSTQFELADLPNYTEYTALYDSYRIYRVDMHFMPIGAGVITNQTSTSFSAFPIFGLVKDYDDAAVPSSFDAMAQYENYQELRLTKQYKITIYPQASGTIFNGNTSPAGYGNLPRQDWIDCAYPAVPYYGIKWGYTNFSGIPTIGWRVRFTYYVEFRGAI